MIEPLEKRRLLTAVVVNTLADQVYPPGTGLVSLRTAFADANASTTPTTITFDPAVFAAPETILLTSTLSLNGNELTTITGPAAQLTISGGGGNFTVISTGQSVPVDLSGFTVADGGFGIGLDGSSTLQNMIVTGNSDSGISYGGSGTATFTNVSAINNGGDGITNHGALVLDTVTASGNGLNGVNNNLTGLSNAGDLTAKNVTAQNNGGRGINVANYTEAVITDSVMSQNTGGGFANGGKATLQDDTISDNSATRGGGILSTAGSDTGLRDGPGGLTLIDVTIAGNSAVDPTGRTTPEGGGIDNSGIIAVNDVTIVGNSAQTSGGGIFNSSPLSFTISNTIVAQNSIVTANGGTGPDFSGNLTSVGFNLIGESDGGGPWLPTDLTGTAAQPLAADLGPLADNGGVTQTFLPLVGSPVINHGSNALVPSGVTTDQRGLTRIYDGTVDIGSVEAQAAAGASIVVSAPASQEAALGVSQSFSLGSFVGTRTTGPYTISVNWGDGSAVLSTTAAAPGTISPQSHSYAAPGTEQVTVTVTDSTGFITANAGFRVSVVALTLTTAPNQTAVIGTSQAFALGSFTETGGTSPYSVDVDWGDGTADAAFTQSGPGTIAPASHIFAAGGTLAVTETITDASGKVSASGSFTVVVTTGTAASSISVQASGTGAKVGSPVTLTATVLPADATGIVTFLAGGGVIGTAQIGAGGIAVLTTTSLGPGTSSITAIYGGSAIYAPSRSTAISVVVATPAAATTISLQISSGSIDSSQSVTLTATVSPSAVDGIAVTGVVTFYQGAIVLGTADIQVDGIAILVTTTSLAIGTDDITAVYGSDANFIGATAPGVTIVVVPTVSRTLLTVSSPSMTVAQSSILTATIEPQNLTPSTLSTLGTTGTVTFTVGGNPIGTATVGTDGVATLDVTGQLSQGINAVVASYSGGPAFQSSSSAGTFVEVTAHALVPVVRRTVVPASVIGGVTFRGSVSTLLTNELSNVEAGPETGYVTIRVYASLAATLDAGAVALIGDVVRKVNIREGRSIGINVPVRSFPASLAGGNYHILVQTTDSKGNIEVVDTGSTVNVAAPTITLSASFVSVPNNLLHGFALLSLTNSGNSDDLSAFTARIGLSTDAAGQNVVASGTGVVTPKRLAVKAGKSAKVRVGGWQSLLAGLPAGSYFLTVTLSDATGHDVTAVSQMSVES